MSKPDYFTSMTFPKIISPKYDGIRCLVIEGVPYSRTGKILPSTQLGLMLASYHGIDGEAIEGNATDHNVYNRTQSHVMAEDKPGDLHFYVFDSIIEGTLNDPFEERLQSLKNYLDVCPDDNIHIIPQYVVNNVEELLKYEEQFLEQGFEGVILRDPRGRYKNGRSTWREQIALKLKREQDDEGVIVDFIEGVTNQNDQHVDELGYAKRSSHQENKIPVGMLGKFKVDFNGDIISVAPGSFSHEERRWIWNNRELVRGRYLKFRHFPHGVKEKPRQPRALGFRDKMDM